MYVQVLRVGAAKKKWIIYELEGNAFKILVHSKSLNDNDEDKLQGKEDNVKLTDDHASFEVQPAPFAFLCSDVAAQLTSHAFRAQDRPLFLWCLWLGIPEMNIICTYLFQFKQP